jgi:hypothetical protein
MASMPKVPCFRVWLKARDLIIGKEGAALIGQYGELTRAKPVGMQSSSPDCTFSTTPTALVFTAENWSIESRAKPDEMNRWIFSASHNGTAVSSQVANRKLDMRLDGAAIILKDLKSVVDGVRLSKSASDAESRALPEFLRLTIERLLERDCASATQEIMGERLSEADVQQVCDLRRRAVRLADGVAAISVGPVEYFSRAPAAITSPGLGRQLVPMHGALASFTIKYSNGQEVFGDALLSERDGRWVFEYFWF